jgi:hypothetical protein
MLQALLALLLAAAPAACDVGDADPGDDDDDNGGAGGDDDDDGANPDLPEDGASCEHELAVTGTLAPAGEPPLPDAGCVPEGTWTVTVTVGDGDCAEVPVAETYVYVVGKDAAGAYTYSYPEPVDPTEQVTMSVRAAGDGSCIGTFVHRAPDESYELLLKPYESDLALAGNGSFTRF